PLSFVISQRRKEIGSGPTGFRWPEQEYALGGEGIVEALENLLLCLLPQVNQHILTGEQVQPGERRIREEIVLGEDTAFADGLVNLVVAIDGAKEVIEPRRGERADRLGGIEASPGVLDCLEVEIGAKQVEGSGKRVFGEKLQHADSKGVNFLSGGTAWYPHPQGGVCGFSCHQTRQDLLGQRLEGGRVSKKPGHADEYVLI